MNGRQQTQAYAQLWTPDNLAEFRVGDLADVPSLGRVEVVGLIPLSLIQVRTSAGGVCKVGYRAAQRLTR